ncbi:MAG TPA: Rieske 2Fe-2S domain-containing protein [Thermomicrobiales bacterium]|nr:Rieske 2Fe-2S domain-containing protein [Thermomicrobiales bacterium]
MSKQAATLSSLLERPAFAWLDSLAEPVQAGAARLLHANRATRRIKDVLNGVPLRHRTHPAVVIWPLGAWTTALLFDALSGLSSGRRRDACRAGAETSIAFGIVGALPAASTGVADWVDLYDHQRRVGMAHAVLNSVALACYAASYALRMGSPGRRVAACALSGVGFGAVLASGALGGDMVYTLGVNVPHTVYPKPPNEFREVLASDELVEGTPVVVEVERVPVLLLRHNGTVFAVQEWCPHAGGPLSRGSFDGDVVECPWHQSRFCLSDGKPVQGPATVPLRTFDAREGNGVISVRPSYEAMSWPPPPAPPRSHPEHVRQDAGE